MIESKTDIKPDYTAAINDLNPKAQFKIENNDYDSIEWLNGTSAISKSDLDAKVASMTTAYNAAQYRSKRKDKFMKKSIQEQLDMQYHDAVNGTSTWKDWVKSIKDAHPKPE